MDNFKRNLCSHSLCCHVIYFFLIYLNQCNRKTVFSCLQIFLLDGMGPFLGPINVLRTSIINLTYYRDK